MVARPAWGTRADDVVPFAMKGLTLEIDLSHLRRRDFSPGRILPAIEAAGHGQPLRGRRLGNEMDDGFVISQWFAAPIRRDKGKKAVLDLVPLAGPRWEMTDRDGQACFIREGLQLQFPQAQPPAVTAAGIRGIRSCRGLRIQPVAPGGATSPG